MARRCRRCAALEEQLTWLRGQYETMRTEALARAPVVAHGALPTPRAWATEDGVTTMKVGNQEFVVERMPDGRPAVRVAGELVAADEHARVMAMLTAGLNGEAVDIPT